MNIETRIARLEDLTSGPVISTWLDLMNSGKEPIEVSDEIYSLFVDAGIL